MICTLVDIEIVGMASLKPSLRKNYMNVKAADGKSLDEKAKQIRADIPKYKASQKKVCIEDILKDSDLGSENIENELFKDGFKRGIEYEIMLVPNIVNITYGRGVGYTFEEEVFDKSITEISATKIRKKLREEGKL